MERKKKQQQARSRLRSAQRELEKTRPMHSNTNHTKGSGGHCRRDQVMDDGSLMDVATIPHRGSVQLCELGGNESGKLLNAETIPLDEFLVNFRSNGAECLHSAYS